MSAASVDRIVDSSELFGHVRGAFTGATATKKGKLALADGGTIFLDEIGTTTPTPHSKFLRVLQEREIEPLGSERTEKIDVRVIVATSCHPRQPRFASGLSLISGGASSTVAKPNDCSPALKETQENCILGLASPTEGGVMFPEVLIPAALVLAIDQASKELILARRHARRTPRLIGFRPQLRPVLNKTLGLGLVTDRRAVLILWGLVILGMLLLLHNEPQFQTSSARIALGTAVGGATSNLIDWLRRGAVIDFIDLRFWPVFNLADAFIVVGVGAALWSSR